MTAIIDCDRCGQTEQPIGETSCGECGEQFCKDCDHSPSAHPGEHTCPEIECQCSGCGHGFPEDELDVPIGRHLGYCSECLEAVERDVLAILREKYPDEETR